MASIIYSSELRDLMLDEATNATGGISKIKIVYSDASSSSYETITWNAASGGSVSQSSDVVFTVAAGKTVESFILDESTESTALAQYYFDTAYVYSENGTFTVRNTTITIPEIG